MQLSDTRAAVLAALAALAVAAPAAAQEPVRVPIAGTISPGSVGECTPPVVSGPRLSWQCTGATETYAGGLASTADAVYEVRGTFNLSSGATKTRGMETFTGCVEGVCGTLEWRWHVTFKADAETAAVVHGQGQARITGGTGGLAGAAGSFTMKCLPEGCAYEGHVLL
jgi:hypothetical protein